MEEPSGNTIYQVDAFTSEKFKGNPAAVLLVEKMPTDSYMQDLAMEMNLSETAFVCHLNDNTFRIRYFTPLNEIPLAGHPTLASAHVLYEIGLIPPAEQITFIANDAQLTIAKEGNSIVMDFPTYPLNKMTPNPIIKSLVGFEPIDLYESSYGWVIAVAERADDITNAKPNFGHLLENNLGRLIITAKSNSPAEDFVVRCFVPSMGVNEDPVTGSAHCALTPLWAEKLKKNKLNSLQSSKRTGRLSLELLGDRVIIKGEAVTVFIAKMK